ncbi:MAG: CDP-archaeol synthase [Candidatus Kerfeldbacteria bacterium]|nr:CDP-archaeol synthase [Candidatus Kerfeldbacteria bacterium]
MIEELLSLTIFFAPAFIANMAAVVWGQGGRPIDHGALVLGHPLFGRNKTVEGFFGGAVTGAVLGGAVHQLGTGFVTPELVVCLAFGALLGDLASSFVKRQLNIPPGGIVPLVDQYDYLLGALAVTVLSYGAVPDAVLASPQSWLIFLALLGIGNLIANRCAYRVHWKVVPY